MRTYFCFLIPRTDLSVHLRVRCALFLLVLASFSTNSLFGQKCPGGLDSIQQISVSLDCQGDVLIAWDAHPGMCYTFSIPSIPFSQTDVSTGRINLTGSGSGLTTGAIFYVNESCNDNAHTDPCQSGSSPTSVDIYEGRIPDLSSLGTWLFKSSGSSSNTKDVGTIFSDSSPVDVPNIVVSSGLIGSSGSIIRPSGQGTTDAKYCIKAEYDANELDSVVLIGDNVTGTMSSGPLGAVLTEYEFCLDAGIGAGTYSNSIIAFDGRCTDTLTNIQTIVQDGSDIPTLACNGFLQISLTGSGTIVTPAMMLPGQPIDNRITFIEGTNTNVLDCTYSGRNVNVVVLDTIHNQKCWGVVAVRNKAIPTLTSSDTTVSCLSNMDSLTSSRLLDIEYNCGDDSQFDITHSDNFVSDDCNTGDTLKIIERTWIVRTENGIALNAISNIVVLKVPFDTIVFPGDTTIYCPDTSFAISNTGGLGVDIDSLVTYCKVQVGFTDRQIPTGCSGMKKIERSWLAIDWCNNVMNDTVQYITLLDTLPPVLSCPIGDAAGRRKLLTTLDTCGAYFTFPSFTATDSCSDDNLITYDVKINGVLETGQDSVFIPVGQAIIEYIARDDCNNEASCFDTITVADNTPPTLNGPSIIQISHSGSGSTLVPISLLAQAFDIDDNCALDSVFLKRMTTPCGQDEDLIFGNSINICCSDTDTLVPIELMARDTAGLTNNLMVLIDVKDAIAPSLTCQDTTIFLDANGDFVVNDSSFFVSSFSDNCGFDVSFSYSRDTLVRADTNAVVELIVTASDIDGSTATCTSMVTVRDTVTNSGMNLLVGRVTDPFNIGLGGIKVKVQTDNNLKENLQTNAQGFFEIHEVEDNEKLSVKIDGYGHEMSGISSLDLLLIQKHILGLESLDNHYLELAADIDQSGSVSVKDLISLQNAILDLPNKSNLPWMFLEENKTAQTLVYSSNEVIPLDPADIEFTAVKIGDVNGDIYNEALGRDKGTVDLIVEKIEVGENVECELPLSILSSEGIVSFYISLNIDTDHNASFIPNSGFGSQTSILWARDNEELKILGFGEFGDLKQINIGHLDIKSSKTGVSTEIITLNVESEVYSLDKEKQKVDLSWYADDIDEHIDQNDIFEISPNPAIENVRIQLNVESTEIKSFHIMDITGKLILDLSDMQSMDYRIPTSLFPSSGSYLVKVESSRGIQNDILLINKK